MPQLLRLRFCNVGPPRARMEDLTISLVDIVTGQATHSAIWLRNGGGKTTLISLLLWLLCPDKPMPDKHQIDDYVQLDDRSVLLAEWQMDKKDKQLSLWSAKPECYLTGVFCERRAVAASQEDRKLHRMFFAARVRDDEPRLSLEELPLYTTRQGQLERRSLASFRQEWRELDHTYPDAGVEYTETLTEWRGILEKIGIDPELFRYQIQMNTREGGAAEPFMFRENDHFVNFFLTFMGEATMGNEIAETIKEFRQTLIFLHQQLDPEHTLLQILIPHFSSLCEVADERERLYKQISSVQQEISVATLAVKGWIKKQEEERSNWQEIEKKAHEESIRLRDDAKLRRRRALLLRYAAAQKRVQQLQTEMKLLQDLVEHTKRQGVIWQAALPLRMVIRARARAASIQEQLNALQKEHEPLLQMLQESARSYAAALSAKRENLRAEEQRLAKLVGEQRAEALQLRKSANAQEIEATKYDGQAKRFAEELAAFHRLHKQLEEQGIMQPSETWVSAQERLQRQQSAQQKDERTNQGIIETLTEKQQELREKKSDLERVLYEIGAQVKLERRLLKPGEEARQKIAGDAVLKLYLEITELDFDRLTPQALGILHDKQQIWEEQVSRYRLTLAEQDAIIQYLSDYGFLPPAQAIAEVIKLLKKEQITAWSGWHYLTTNVREADIRDWVQRLPELAFGVVVPDEYWQQTQSTLQTTQPYLETPVILFAQGDLREDISAHGWAIGPTSDAYFNRDAGSHELLERQARRHQLQADLDELSKNTKELKSSINRLDHTFEHYPTSWWQEHQSILAQALEQQHTLQSQQKPLEQELQYCTAQITKNKQDLQEIQKSLRNLDQQLIHLQASEAQLTVDPDILKAKQQEHSGKADACRDEANQFQIQAGEKDNEANETAEQGKHIVGEIKVTERERSEIHHLVGEPPTPNPGDIQTLRAHYESLFEQYHQKIGSNELTVLLDSVQKEERQAYQQFQRTLQKPTKEEEVESALRTLADLDDADQRYRDALSAQSDAEHESKNKQKDLSQAKQEMQKTKQQLTGQSIDESELEGKIPEREEDCTKEAEEDEKTAGTSEQAAQQKRNEEQEAIQQVKQCSAHVETLGHVQRRIRTIQESYDPLLKVVAGTELAQEGVNPHGSLLAEEILTTLHEEEIDHTLEVMEGQLKHMQGDKERLDQRGRRVAHDISRALNETSREFKEVSIAKRFLEHDPGAYEQRCHSFLDELLSRQTVVEGERKNILVYKDTLVQRLLALADSGVRFLSSASKYSKLPATLPAFEQRPFLRIQVTMPASKEEQVGKITHLLDTIVDGGTIPSGTELLQQAVRYLASPITVQILFPDPGTLHYVPPNRLMKESGGERLTSMVLLYCTLLRMRAAHRTKAAGKSSCLILDNPIGVASRVLFLELQREVAESMDIQLIYTTAIKDFEALRIFPNIVRISNDQHDRRTGHHLLTLDTSSTNLESMRIMHSESRDFPRERQNGQA
jgi:hypothetical protein